MKKLLILFPLLFAMSIVIDPILEEKRYLKKCRKKWSNHYRKMPQHLRCRFAKKEPNCTIIIADSLAYLNKMCKTRKVLINEKREDELEEIETREE